MRQTREAPRTRLLSPPIAAVTLTALPNRLRLAASVLSQGPATHDALMAAYSQRFTNQVQTVSTDQTLSEWKPE